METLPLTLGNLRSLKVLTLDSNRLSVLPNEGTYFKYDAQCSSSMLQANQSLANAQSPVTDRSNIAISVLSWHSVLLCSLFSKDQNINMQIKD